MPWTNPKTWSVGELVTAANMNTHVRDNELALGRDVYGVRNVGTAGGLGERWYVAGPVATSGETPSGTSFAIGRLHTLPLLSPRGGTLDRIAFNVTTAIASGLARVGIYQATSATNLYPDALIVDGGEFSTATTGIKSATINVTLAPDLLYWAVFIMGTAAASVSGLGAQLLLMPSVLGMDNAFGAGAAWFRRDFTYGALPSTYPAGPPTAYIATGATPIIALRYSA